ncbi:DUF692 family multinuclear iron-containing protein [Pseudomonas sp. 65/3-MNA-CIBAN-0223]|jgi:uncharacterized protein (UPF0276 family)
MNIDSISLGVSGDINKLKQFIDFNSNTSSIYRGAPIKHFSLGVRPWEKLENSIIDVCATADFTISVHPVDINFSGVIDMSELANLKKITDILPVRYIEEDIGIWRNENLFLGAHQTNPPLNKKSLQTTIINANMVKNFLELPLLLENPPVYSEFGSIPFWDFYLELCFQSGCSMAFDIGHYLGYCKSKDLDFSIPDGKHEIWSFIKTLHISGIKSWMWNGIPVWLDQHSDPYNIELMEAFKPTIIQAYNTDNILLEMEGASIEVEQYNINLVKKTLAEVSENDNKKH